MKSSMYSLVCSYFIVLVLPTAFAETRQNLSCYQCVRDTETECNESDLRPCTNIADRCVIHMKKDPDSGFVLKRECGLGPCSFDDDMTRKGLGLGNCDRSKESYFCISCCKGNGCNKSGAAISTPKFFVVVASLLVIIVLEIIKGFQPPYAPENERV